MKVEVKIPAGVLINQLAASIPSMSLFKELVNVTGILRNNHSVLTVKHSCEIIESIKVTGFELHDSGFKEIACPLLENVTVFHLDEQDHGQIIVFKRLDDTDNTAMGLYAVLSISGCYSKTGLYSAITVDADAVRHSNHKRITIPESALVDRDLLISALSETLEIDIDYNGYMSVKNDDGNYVTMTVRVNPDEEGWIVDVVAISITEDLGRIYSTLNDNLTRVLKRLVTERFNESNPGLTEEPKPGFFKHLLSRFKKDN